MGKSMKRVTEAAAAAGLDLHITRLGVSARTAQDAATACDCMVGQIAKSLIFEGAQSGALKLVIVSGAHDLDLSRATERFGEDLLRADPKRVRTDTGFAIGGVAPIGHLSPLQAYMDTALLHYDTIWAAGGAPDAVFEIAPQALLKATGATVFANV